MKILSAAIALSILATSQVDAQTCRQVGLTTICDNGVTARQIGNSTIYNNGVVDRQIGDTTIG